VYAISILESLYAKDRVLQRFVIRPLEDFAGQSLRAGQATSAEAAGKSERAIMNQTKHRYLKTVPLSGSPAHARLAVEFAWGAQARFLKS